MANRVRGIRQRLPSNVLLGRLNGAGGPAQALSLTSIANAIIQGGAIPLPGGGGFITAVDSNFTVTGGTLSLHTIAAGDLIGNSTGSTAEPTATTLTALLDQAVGNTKGDILYRDTSVWQVLAPGSNGKVLTLASGIPSWATASGGTTLTAKGAWNGFVAYNPGDIVTYNGSAYLNYVAIAAPVATAQQWVNITAMTISTTNTTNDTANSTVGGGGNANCRGNLGKSAGKWYFEFFCTGLSGNGDQIAVTPIGGVFSQDFDAQHGGTISGTQSGSGSGSFAGITNGKQGGVVLDIDNGLFWVCEDVQAGSPNWNGSSSNVPLVSGGIAIGAMSTPLYPAFYIQNPSQTCVLFTTPALFLGSVPGGASPWSTPSSPTTSPDMDDGHWLSQGAIIVGTTEVGSGTTGRLLYDNGGIVGEAVVGSGLSLSGGTLTASGGSGTIPTFQVFTSGSAATYTTPAGVKWIRVRMVGGGGGGAGANSSTGAQVAGSAGGDTIFNSIHAAGGSGASAATSSAPGTGGLGGTGGTGSATFRAAGNGGGGTVFKDSVAANAGGAAGGGSSVFGGGGAGAGAAGSGASQSGGNAVANTGGGGGGATDFSVTYFNVGASGGGGESVELVIGAPSGTYTYTVGASGAGGSSTANGGNGAAGIIVVEEHYNA